MHVHDPAPALASRSIAVGCRANFQSGASGPEAVQSAWARGRRVDAAGESARRTPSHTQVISLSAAAAGRLRLETERPRVATARSTSARNVGFD
jgi:hypothetical protein